MVTINVTKENYLFHYFKFAYPNCSEAALRVLASFCKYSQIDAETKENVRFELDKSKFVINNNIKYLKEKGFIEKDNTQTKIVYKVKIKYPKSVEQLCSKTFTVNFTHNG